MSSSTNEGTSAWGAVTAAWSSLRTKGEYDAYNAVSTDDDPEGKIQLPHNTPVRRDYEEGPSGDADESLLEGVRVQRQKKPSAASLFLKAVAVTLVLLSVFGVYKLFKWIFVPESGTTPIEVSGMPVFGENLGCDHASVFYEDAPKGHILNVPSPKGIHHVKIMGSGAGTMILTSGSKDDTHVSYKIVMKSTQQSLLDLVKLEANQATFGSTVSFMTPAISKADIDAGLSCMKFDIVMSIPPTLKELSIFGNSDMQVKFDPRAHLDMKRLSVVLFGRDHKNIILPTTDFHAESLSLEVFNGWIVGEIAIVGDALIDTQRSDAIANVKIFPTEPKDGKIRTARFRTATGSGRSDFAYITTKKTKERPINSHHISSRNGDVYLKYEEADFNGKIAMNSRNSTIYGSVTDLRSGSRLQMAPRDDDDDQWTHARGSSDGKDRISVESNGWTGLWF